MTAGEGPFRVQLVVRTRPGTGPEFERVWQQGAELIAGQPANRGQWLSRSTRDPELYYVVSDWTDEASFRTYERCAAHAEHLERLRPYRVDGAMATMQVVRDVAASGGGRGIR